MIFGIQEQHRGSHGEDVIDRAVASPALARIAPLEVSNMSRVLAV